MKAMIIIKTAVGCLAQIFSLLLPYSLGCRIYRLFWYPFYTTWIAREFKAFGNLSIIKPHVSLVSGQKYISIGSNTRLGARIQLTAWNRSKELGFVPEIVIGDNCEIGDDAHITAVRSIHIGSNVLTGKKILITDNAHGDFSEENSLLPPAHRCLYSKGGIVIEDNVWIGEKVSIMSNVHIGCSSIIAANSVVTHDVPANCIVGGIPAKILKQIDL